jgi:hypothetical protein
MSTEVSRRPFYAEYAWAYDLLIDRPVRKECAVIAGWLIDRGIPPGAEVLDAGCGTGRYAIELDILLERHGFGRVSYFGAYDPGIAAEATDRLVVAAERLDSAV